MTRSRVPLHGKSIEENARYINVDVSEDYWGAWFDLSKPFIIKAERAVRLFNKRLNGVVIFGNSESLMYGKIDKLTGEVSPAMSDSYFSELTITYKEKSVFTF